ncbi:chemotaxis protein CheW, partial [bacterium]|nr:chemotaxis protein CheW [bacterium]
VPNSSPYIEGVINLRGRILPVFNVAKKLKLASRDEKRESTQAVMVVEMNGEDAGLLVDRVDDVVKIRESDIDHTARRVQAEANGQFIEGTVVLRGRLITLLRLGSLLEE